MRNLTLLTDLYEMTMMYGYSRDNHKDKIAIFDVFYRGVGNNYAIACGLEQVVEYIKNLHFDSEDIEYLRSLKIFDEYFLELLKDFKFTGDMYACPEGTVVFPHEPIITIVAPLFEAQFIETAILCILNHQTLIATKASHIVYNAEGLALSEQGLRRAQGPDAGIYGTRASYIAGFDSSSNVLAGRMFDIPIAGTMAHSYIMSYDSELEAFRKFSEIYPDNCILLVDTIDTLKSGVPNAITVFHELKAKGHKPLAIRIDSGDLAYLSIKAREMLDNAGLEEVKIVVSGDIDEYIIRSLKSQGAKIDILGIGTKLITSEDCPSLGGVYKLAGIYNEKGELEYKIKKSNTIEKVTNPGFKKIVRFYDKQSNKAIADLICLKHEDYSNLSRVEIFDPKETWKKMTLTNFYTEELMVKVFESGKLIYKLPSINEIRKNTKASLSKIWDEYKRDINPHIYKVDLSKELFDIKMKLLNR